MTLSVVAATFPAARNALPDPVPVLMRTGPAPTIALARGCQRCGSARGASVWCAAKVAVKLAAASAEEGTTPGPVPPERGVPTAREPLTTLGAAHDGSDVANLEDPR